MACLEETYKHWKEDTDRQDTAWERGGQGPEGYEENEGYVFDFFIPVSDSDQTMHVLTPYIKHWMGSTAWALSALTSLSTGTSSFPHNTSPSMKRGSSLTGSLKGSQTIPPTQQCTIIPGPRKTGESQLSSSGTMTHMLKLLPWLQSNRAWLLPSKRPKSSWTKASNDCLGLMPTIATNYSMPFIRAPTSTQNPGGSSPPSPEAHTAVRLDPDRRVMSQGGLQRGKRTAKVEG